MGLVDEYEQRQLAFIEHVRSILAQQHQGLAGSGLINLSGSSQASNHLSALAIIPTVTSSSTTVHRVSNSGRRSHSGRHHRHHHRSSSSYVDTNGLNSGVLSSVNAEPNVISINGAGSSRSHNRIHRHHHRHHNHSQSRTQINTNTGHNHQIANNMSQVNFDANRRGQLHIFLTFSFTSHLFLMLIIFVLEGLIIQNVDGSGTAGATVTVEQNRTSLEDTALSMNQPHYSDSTVATSSGSSSLNTAGNKTTSGSVNLRDKIAKLIKDIVVHHGDNIQYVQLADQLNTTIGNSISSANHQPESSFDSENNTLSNISNIMNQTDSNDNNNNNETQERQEDNHNNNNNNNNNNNSGGNEDDVPLIQP